LGQINQFNNGFSINEEVVVVVVVVWMNVMKTSYLVEVEIIIKGDQVTKAGGAKPCQGVATNREEDKCHIQLQSLGCTFGNT
jgi:hypothetical protein